MDPRERLRELAEQANVDIDVRVPPKRYFRSGVELVRMAQHYEQEGSLESAYVLYMKYIILFVEKIHKHPNYESVPVELLHGNKSTLRMVFGKAEKIKEKLKDIYIKQYHLRQEEQRRLKQQQEKEELRRRKLEERQRQEEEAKMRFEEEKRKLIHEETGINHQQVETPRSPLHSPDSTSPSTVYPVNGFQGTDEYTPRIEAQLNDLHVADKKINPEVPSRSLKPDLNKRTSSSTLKPAVDRSTKPASLLSPSLHNKVGLREVIVPGKLVVKFLDLAEPNTARNLETCGILAGTMSKSHFVITHLVIPKQTATSDSCTTTNEEDLFSYQDKYDLITLGWIHTHPTQTAFLSSVDLHTHLSYQLMMPEALAIVCAPKHSQTGYFCLSPNYGLEFIANCQETGFHPHPTHPPLFQEAEHVRVDESVDVMVADFR